jgi:hypothetical protein
MRTLNLEAEMKSIAQVTQEFAKNGLYEVADDGAQCMFDHTITYKRACDLRNILRAATQSPTHSYRERVTAMIAFCELDSMVEDQPL